MAETTGVNVIDKAAELSRAVGVAQSMLAMQSALGEKLAGRGLHSFPFPLNLSVLCPFPLNFSLHCPPYNPT